MLYILLSIIIGYLFGSIPWALIIGKVFYKKDIREYGSHNLGASNSWMELSKPAGVAVAVLDASKALLAMIIVALISPENVTYAGLSACVGHCYPIFAEFKGGKATASAFGYFLGLAYFINQNYFWQFFFPIICIFGILFLSRMITFSSMVTMFIETLVSIFIIKNPTHVSVCIFLLWVLIMYRHRKNIKNIIEGTEYKISFKKKEKKPE